ncbi:MAG: hypothetical protein CBR30_03400 [Dictyoglomus sp. NZ13-RE01]|nr:MAG: hypothetical protein CBR30_03400 [Dictyoglomus sp. NZ13-RE01]
MKKFLHLTIFILSILSLTFAQETYDFRKVTWGMTKADVLKAEKKTPIFEDENDLIFEETLLNRNFSCLYVFQEDKLYSAGYILTDKYEDYSDYVDLYIELKDLLSEKYGKPIISKDPEIFPIGNFNYSTSWFTPRSVIMLSLSRKSGEYTLMIAYIDVNFVKKEIDKSSEEKNKDKTKL